MQKRSTVKSILTRPSPQTHFPKSSSISELPQPARLKVRRQPQRSESGLLSTTHNYSSLTENPEVLMRTSFKKPKPNFSCYPPVLNQISRTLAAPLVSGKRDLGPNARIASYYNKEARRLVIDRQSRKLLVSQEDPVPSVQFPSGDEAAKYRKYIDEQIPDGVVAPLEDPKVSQIVSLIKFRSKTMKKKQMFTVISSDLEEVKAEHNKAGKKAILDYILKDENQRKRLGFDRNPDPPEEWGQREFKGIIVDEVWTHNIFKVRLQLAGKLCAYSPVFLRLEMLWQQYASTPLLDLPVKYTSMLIQDFTELQERQIVQGFATLKEEWAPAAIELIKEEAKKLGMNKGNRLIESTAVFSYNRLRALVASSIQKYIDFFKSFDLKNPPNHKTMSARIPKVWPECFLLLKLQIKDGKVMFNWDASQIWEMLKKVLELIATHSSNFPKAGNGMLWPLVNLQEVISNCEAVIPRIIQNNVKIAAKSVKLYNEFQNINSDRKIVEAFIAEDHTRDEYRELIEQYLSIRERVQKSCPILIRMNMIEIDCREVNKFLIKECDDIFYILCKSIFQKTTEKTKIISSDIESIIKYLGNKADTIEKIIDLENFKENSQESTLPALYKQYDDVRSWYRFLFEYSAFKIRKDSLFPLYECNNSVRRVNNAMFEISDRLSKEKDILISQLKDTRKGFSNEISAIDTEIHSLKISSEKSLFKEYIEQINILNQKLGESKKLMKKINDDEELLGWTPTEYSRLDELIKLVVPYDELWNLVGQCKTTIENSSLTPIQNLEVKLIEQEALNIKIKSKYLYESLRSSAPQPSEVAQMLTKDIKKFMKQIPIMYIFSTKGLEKRHLDEMSMSIGKEPGYLSVSQSAPFKSVQAYKLEKFAKNLETIAEKAFREYTNLQQLNRMKKEFEQAQFEVTAADDTVTIKTTSFEAIQGILEEQTFNTQSMKSSPYALVHMEEVDKWAYWLGQMHEILDYLIKIQALWVLLDPLFVNSDMQRNLKTEYKNFVEVNQFFRDLIEDIKENPLVMPFSKKEGLIDKLSSSSVILEGIESELYKYLENKRKIYPRFFFLSNEEMLEVLKQTKGPTSINQYLKKCFYGVKSLTMKDDEITGLISHDGEHLPFLSPIDLEATKGSVENWFIYIEDAMQQTLREAIVKMTSDSLHLSDLNWLHEQIGQVILTSVLVNWTYTVENLLTDNKPESLREYFQNFCTSLEHTIVLNYSDISPEIRAKLQALLLCQLKCRDVLDSLITDQVQSLEDFQWAALLKYYMEDDQCHVRMFYARLSYYYEYIGNPDRLVMTTINDRCIRTLACAMHFYYSLSAEGPASTGKSETIKELAKALGRNCIIFNCSDGLDYAVIAKFFKGIAMTGAWVCYDEFNLVFPEVLSIIVQYLGNFQNCLKRGESTIHIDGDRFQLLKNGGIFITYNPFYKGRYTLPDNLKAMFRNVTMILPNFVKIGDTILLANGFRNTEVLARKIVAATELSATKLSVQSHYDYGMRTIKSILVSARNLKITYPDVDEFFLVRKSISDTIKSRLIAQDVELFNRLISDLFQDGEEFKTENDALKTALVDSAEALGLNPKEYTLNKLLEFYSMIKVRHGIALLGRPFSGKTSAVQVLSDALTTSAEVLGDHPASYYRLFTKSIQKHQLYGEFEDTSGKWIDGVFSKGFKGYANDSSLNRKWILLDGEIDVQWAEDMNSLLDENKKLCLQSGEIIFMSPNTIIIFEAIDLVSATPATVSRLGIIYFEGSEVHWEGIFNNWKKTGLPSTFKENEEVEVSWMADWLIEPTLRQLETKIKTAVPLSSQSILTSFLRMFEFSLSFLADEEVFAKYDDRARVNIIDSTFLFCMTWTFGGCVSSQHRRVFNGWMQRLVGGDVIELMKKWKKITPLVGEDGSFYDYYFDPEEIAWKHWTGAGFIDIDAPIPRDLKASEIVVPTIDTIRYKFLILKLIKNGIPTIFCGSTGTGKTIYIKDTLYNKLEPNVYDCVEILFNSNTNAGAVQDIVDVSTSVIRGKKGVYGPPPDKKCVVFIDDINMPRVDASGSQPPIELLRQFLDQKGWYAKRDNNFKTILDTTLISAMGNPSGDKNKLSDRFLRHTTLIAFADLDEESMLTIFTTIIQWHFSAQRFNESVMKIEKKLIQSTKEVFKMVLADLPPTPHKFHYTFNIRDIYRVIMGLCLSSQNTLKDYNSAIRLWTHEIFRVFGDSLIDDGDRLILFNFIRTNCKKMFNVNFDVAFSHLDSDNNGRVETLGEIQQLTFGFFSREMDGSPIYTEITDIASLNTKCQNALRSYNEVFGRGLDIVLFPYVIEHICRISRILHMERGNALLIGVPGTGRQSITRLAASMGRFKMFSMAQGQGTWHEQLKKLQKESGGKGECTVAMFTDNDIKEDSFLEDINSLMNTGDVSSLYTKEEQIDIAEMIRPAAYAKGQEGNTLQLYNFFTRCCQECIRVVLCFSPVGMSLRHRLRAFPSLAHCSTINWMSAWPEEAILAIADQFVDFIESPEPYAKLCAFFYNSSRTWAETMLEEQRRYYYVNSSAYMDMMRLFKDLLGDSEEKALRLQGEYQTGHQNLLQTERTVLQMQKQLKELKPQLEEAQKETESKLVVVEVNKQESEAIAKVFREEEEVARDAAERAEKIKTECDEMLAECRVLVDEATNALRVLNKDDIAKIKKAANPPQLIRNVLEAVCILFDINPPRKQNPTTMQMEPQWLEASLKLLSRADLIKDLEEFKKEGITKKQIKKLKKHIKNPEFNPENMKNKVSSSAAGLCAWVIAMEKFYHVYQDMLPIEAAQVAAQEEYDEKNRHLELKENELKIVQEKVQALQEDLELAHQKKNDLQQRIDTCEKRLSRAKSLLKSLETEKSAWAAKAQMLEESRLTIQGNSLLAAAIITYLGPFSGQYRGKIMEEWTKELADNGVSLEENFSLVSNLGDPVKIMYWNIYGLPTDKVSIENAITIFTARKWPLMIDPESQGVSWIKAMEGKEGSLLVVNQTDPNFSKKVQISIDIGGTILVENISETISLALEGMLVKDTSAKHKLYIATQLRNPHYLPEITSKVVLINFSLNADGLADQLLGLIVNTVVPELGAEREKLIVNRVQGEQKLQEIESSILEIVASNSETILDDDEAITVLTQSKETSEKLLVEKQHAKQTEEQIELARGEYKPLADYISLLFFCAVELSSINYMYQFSLSSFKALFIKSIQFCIGSESMLNSIQERFLSQLYSYVSRSLFEKHRLVFSLSLSLKTLQARGEIDLTEVRFLLTGGISFEESLEDKPQWLSSKSWLEIKRLDKLPRFSGICESMTEQSEDWKAVTENLAPMPEPWSSFSDFHKLCIMRTLRLDKMESGLYSLINSVLGKEFCESKALDIDLLIQDSSKTTPIIQLLTPGSTFLTLLQNFADSSGKKLEIRSLGKDPGTASSVIEMCLDTGDWVILMNCHLSLGWVQTLERRLESIFTDEQNPEFRLWMTTTSSNQFPIGLLQKSIIITHETPTGIKSNVMRNFMSDLFIDQNNEIIRKMIFGMTIFHAILQERKLYGPLGWNCMYEFNSHDLKLSSQEFNLVVKDKIPYDTLKYLVSECNYGGRIIDDRDKRLMQSLLSDFLSPKYLHEECPDNFLDYIESLPNISDPQLCGFNLSAGISKDIRETNKLFQTFLQTFQVSSSSSISYEGTIRAIIDQIMTDPLPALDEEGALRKFPQSKDSLNSSLHQEINRYNILTQTIRSSLNDLLEILEGRMPMTSGMERMMRSLYNGKVPTLWREVSYLTVKGLASYIKNLKSRVLYFQAWTNGGCPSRFDISKFFLIKSFITSVAQNYSRKNSVTFDTLQSRCELVREDSETYENGVLLYGFYLEGARWSKKKWALAEGKPMQIYADAPLIHLTFEHKEDQEQFYECPLYKTSARVDKHRKEGTNFVTYVKMRTEVEPSHWVKRGVALIIQIDD